MRSVMIVRRQLSAAYYSFLGITTAENGVTLVVDRRTCDRRGTNREDREARERRNEDRRGKPPASWFKEGFIVTLAGDDDVGVSRQSNRHPLQKHRRR